MKIAIPLAEGKLAVHFGHCQTFALIDIDENNKKIVKKEEIVPPPHEPGLLPRWLAEKKVNLIIAGGMGERAFNLFSQNGIKVIVGAGQDDAEKLISDYFNDSLQTGKNACDH